MSIEKTTEKSVDQAIRIWNVSQEKDGDNGNKFNLDSMIDSMLVETKLIQNKASNSINSMKHNSSRQ